MTKEHQFQLLAFAEDPLTFTEKYSTAFEKGFLHVLKTKFGSDGVSPTKVYKQYISCEKCIYLNATRWNTLSEFVRHIEKSHKCVVHHRKKGRLLRLKSEESECTQRKRKFVPEDDEARWKVVEAGINAIVGQNRFTLSPETTNAVNVAVDENRATVLMDQPKGKQVKVRPKITMKLVKRIYNTERITPNSLTDEVSHCPAAEIVSDEEPDVSSSTFRKTFRHKISLARRPRTAKETSTLKRKSALDIIMEHEEAEKEQFNRKDYWLHPGIVVKVTTHKLGDKYINKKAVVLQLVDAYTAMIQMLSSGGVLYVDQEHVVSVLPSCKKHVRIVNGAYRNQVVILKEVMPHGCSVSICAGPFNGRVLTGVRSKDICKIHHPK
ncbi:DNA/RNA-binding protein KIN17-like [Gigantopelta aegis]|uniref:DNA/RNA-binding protein KIN17-like n=1 Tax=Gigantopelta aegis TaxID=1735272 RepID=UPI001B88B68F|nr:DNA/RNA-binding protein KIN17-like [Gigantopelta aegis]